jgi:hypothetical protein
VLGPSNPVWGTGTTLDHLREQVLGPRGSNRRQVTASNSKSGKSRCQGTSCNDRYSVTLGNMGAGSCHAILGAGSRHAILGAGSRHAILGAGSPLAIMGARSPRAVIGAESPRAVIGAGFSPEEIIRVAF